MTSVSLSDLKAKRAAMTQGEWESIDEFVYDCRRAIVEALVRADDATGIVATHSAADVLSALAKIKP